MFAWQDWHCAKALPANKNEQHDSIWQSKKKESHCGLDTLSPYLKIAARSGCPPATACLAGTTWLHQNSARAWKHTHQYSRLRLIWNTLLPFTVHTNRLHHSRSKMSIKPCTYTDTDARTLHMPCKGCLPRCVSAWSSSRGVVKVLLGIATVVCYSKLLSKVLSC